MTSADRAQAAQRLLDDPLVKELWAEIETKAIDAMLIADCDQGRREARDTVNIIRALRQSLEMAKTVHQEQTRFRPAVA